MSKRWGEAKRCLVGFFHTQPGLTERILAVFSNASLLDRIQEYAPSPTRRLCRLLPQDTWKWQAAGDVMKPSGSGLAPGSLTLPVGDSVTQQQARPTGRGRGGRSHLVLPIKPSHLAALNLEAECGQLLAKPHSVSPLRPDECRHWLDLLWVVRPLGHATL